MYDEGRGVAQSHSEALEWYRKAAEQGLPRAQYILGVMYSGGEGVAQNHVQAYLWFDLCASTAEGNLREAAVEMRDRVSEKMAPARIAEAQRLAREWRLKIKELKAEIEM